MDLEQFMGSNYPNLMLRPPLFYEWDIGVRFELGVDMTEKCHYMRDVYHRAITLFRALHKDDEKIFVVANVHYFGRTRKSPTLSKYIRNKSVLYQLQHQTIPYVFPEDNEEGKWTTERFWLECRSSDIQYTTLLEAICNQDMGLKPIMFHDIFFINTERGTIFHVYDDRGCDLIATSPESIRTMYDTYNEWILNYDRKKIDKVFK
ncbi:DUF3885 domain-containing protein [Psychrobacillus sp. OK032]|uniref:DUF3885 domain-containing protein n=1 Tax=Psychrobacillus sp. OK032 TaxID=1884358 RepID=UPI0008D70137|nr:DUF3885 domain-containing protein [Psychrobacillus sp. OK032]SES12119.1 protein of unknown function [Psychrobacillus sp. OK032]